MLENYFQNKGLFTVGGGKVMLSLGSTGHKTFLCDQKILALSRRSSTNIILNETNDLV